MSPPVPHRRPARTHRRHLERERRVRRLAVLLAIAVVALVVLLVSAFGGGGRAVQAPTPASAARLVPAGPPTPEIVARLGALHLQLPVSQTRVTTIGYQGGAVGALALAPLQLVSVVVASVSPAPEPAKGVANLGTGIGAM